jgi:REP element-mobilizing transposase RayT
MSEYVHKSHNVSVLMYHLVFPAKYRDVVFDGAVEAVLRDPCLEIEKRYENKLPRPKGRGNFLNQHVVKNYRKPVYARRWAKKFILLTPFPWERVGVTAFA